VAGGQADREFGWPAALGLLALMLVSSFAVYAPVLDGEFVSDDVAIIVDNPYVQELGAENIAVILDPTAPGILWGMNYAPVHLLVHAVERHVFGLETWGYHVVNVILHALNGLLVVMLLRSSRLPLVVAGAAGLVFLLHPAHVETVGMVFQVKTLLSTALALASILLLARHPGLACLLFALALLTKISAAFVLPVAALLCWVRQGDEVVEAPRPIWLLAFLAVLVLVGIPEMSAFQRVGSLGISPVEGPAEQARWMVALATRYLRMAVSGLGVSAFHQPTPPRSWLDPWWLSGLLLLAVLSWRWIAVLRRRDEEAVYWLLAVAAYAPVSQVFAFLFPMADRYLYAPLIGLLGGGLLAAREGWLRFSAWRASRGARASGDPVWAGALLVAVALSFGYRAHQRAPVVATNRALSQESTRNYPKGVPALIDYAKRDARTGNVPAVGRELEALLAAGFVDYTTLLDDPAIAGLVGYREVQRPLNEMARATLDRLSRAEDPFQIELVLMAGAHNALGNTDEVIELLERARAKGGPHQAEVEAGLRSRDAAGSSN
jgi:hypothetical protein